MQLLTEDRPATSPLLLKPSGDRWRKSDHSRLFRRVVKAAHRDPAEVTIYALRHSNIVRQILAGVPIRVVAVNHDTSVAMIERTYSRYIGEHAHLLARGALREVRPYSDRLQQLPQPALSQVPGRGRPHDHHRDLRGRLPATSPANRASRDNQNRYLMNVDASYNTARFPRWSSTGNAAARPDACSALHLRSCASPKHSVSTAHPNRNTLVQHSQYKSLAP